MYCHENYDVVTGLPNRIDFLKSFDISSHNDTKTMVLLLRINTLESLSHDLDYSDGNHILKQIADRLKMMPIQPTYICRYAYNEFLITISNISTYIELYNYVNDIITRCTDPIYLSNNEFCITVNTGISLYPSDSNYLVDLVYKADLALFQSILQGPNQFYLFNNSLLNDTPKSHKIHFALQSALSNNELYVVFQPKISTQSGYIIGFEVLVRWEHPTLGNIPPFNFISIAESTGMIIPIGLFVFEESCRRCKELIDLGYKNLKFSINVSKVQLQDTNIVNDFLAILNKYDLDPSYIELELTENILANVVSKDILTLQQFKDVGISIALDDFGTGASSFQYLKVLPIDTLKIDKSFISDIGINPKVDPIIRCLINMSHQLQMSVVAEGVETLNHVNFLKELACDVLQGYYYSKPIYFDQVLPLLQ